MQPYHQLGSKACKKTCSKHEDHYTDEQCRVATLLRGLTLVGELDVLWLVGCFGTLERVTQLEVARHANAKKLLALCKLHIIRYY